MKKKIMYEEIICMKKNYFNIYILLKISNQFFIKEIS